MSSEPIKASIELVFSIDRKSFDVLLVKDLAALHIRVGIFGALEIAAASNIGLVCKWGAGSEVAIVRADQVIELKKWLKRGMASYPNQIENAAGIFHG